MNKKGFLGLITVTLALGLGVAVNLKKSSPNPPKHFGAMDAPLQRDEWMKKRLVDPETGIIPENFKTREMEYLSSGKILVKENPSKALVWTKRGPYNVGGRTRAFAVDVINSQRLIAGGVSGGIWKSEDGGVNWSKATKHHQLHNVTCVVQDTRVGKENIWYAGSGELYGNSASGGDYSNSTFRGDGFLKSVDGGQTWDTLSSTYSGTPHKTNIFDFCWNMATDPSIDTADIVYAAMRGSIYRSLDGGDTWASVKGTGTTDSYFTDILVTPDGIKYATFSTDGTSDGVYRSENGTNWTKINTTGFPSTFDRIVMTYDPQDYNVIYFLGHTPGGGKQTFNFMGDAEKNSLWKYTYVSGNGTGTGGIWENRSPNLPIGPYPFDDFTSQGGYDLVIKVKPDDSNTIFIGGTSLYRSTDGFTTMNNITHIGGYVQDTELPDFKIVNNHHPDQHGLFFSPTDPNVLYSTHDGGISKVNDCTVPTIEWESLNNGYITTQFYTVAIDHGSTNDVVIGGLQDNGTQFTSSPSPQDPWLMSLSYDGAHCAIEDGGNTYYMSIQSGRILKMQLNSDGSPQNLRRIDPIGGIGYDFINPFIIDPLDNKIMYLSAGTSLWRNNDLSGIALTNEWDSISTNWQKLTATTVGNISCFGPTYTGSHRLYIGTSSGRIYRIDNANTGDPTFTDVKNNISGTGYVSSLSVDPRDDNKVLAVFSNYNAHSVHYSSDGGQTWWKVSGNLEGEIDPGTPDNLYHKNNGPSCRWGEIIPLGDKTVYMVGTSVGLFATDTLVLGTDITNDTTKWYQQGADIIGNVVVDMMDYRTNDGTIAVATHGAGIYTAKIKDIAEINGFHQIKSSHNELNIYPNPVKDILNIDADLESNSQLNIYDVNGRLVKSIKSFQNDLRIDVSDLKTGVYFIRFQGAERQQSVRFVKI